MVQGRKLYKNGLSLNPKIYEIDLVDYCFHTIFQRKNGGQVIQTRMTALSSICDANRPYINV